jgi:hypothetical protein
MFVGLHVLLAERWHSPEMAISPDEGKEFMFRAQNVARHYSVEATQKALDWAAFTGIALMMYGTRIVAIRNRHAAERAAAKGETVVHLFGHEPSPNTVQ